MLVLTIAVALRCARLRQLHVVCLEHLAEGGILLREVVGSLCNAGEVRVGVCTHQCLIHAVQLCVCVCVCVCVEGGEGGEKEQPGNDSNSLVI